MGRSRYVRPVRAGGGSGCGPGPSHPLHGRLKPLSLTGGVHVPASLDGGVHDPGLLPGRFDTEVPDPSGQQYRLPAIPAASLAVLALQRQQWPAGCVAMRVALVAVAAWLAAAIPVVPYSVKAAVPARMIGHVVLRITTPDFLYD